MNTGLNLNTYKKLDGCTLKMIAVMTMLIDHIGASLFPSLLIFRYIGRLAFPIYCYMLVEGARYTHDYKKYMIRMGLFALISEIPFDLAFYGSVMNMGHQNVFFTLFIGLGMIWLMEHPINNVELPDVIYKMLVFAVAGIVAEVLRTDYGFTGIVIIYAFYALHDMYLVAAAVVAVVCIYMGRIEAYAIFSLLLLALYNGKRGHQTKIMQYGFYAFYPVHLLILGIIKAFI